MCHFATTWLAKSSQNHGGVIEITLRLLGGRKFKKTTQKLKSQRFDGKTSVTWGAQARPGSPKTSKKGPSGHPLGW